MSFNVGFIPCRYGGKTAQVMNPFTKKPQEIEVPEAMTSAEWEAVVRLLRVPDRKFDSLQVDFPDGGRVHVSNGEGPFESINVRIGGLSPDSARFLFDLLQAADWMMMDDSSGTLFVSSERLATGLPGGEPATVCGSADELRAHLSGGFDAWNRLRNQVAGETKPPRKGPKRRPKK